MAEKWRGLFEGPEWEQSRLALSGGGDIRRWDDGFRWIARHLATSPRTATTPFLSDDHRILRWRVSLTMELWVYFRIESDDESCTLLWIAERRHDLMVG